MRRWFVLVLLMPFAAAAQPFAPNGPEKLIIGGRGGVFRIAYDDFTSIYDGRTGLAYGGHVLYKIRAPYFITGGISFFERDGKVASSGAGARWQQRGIHLGVRYVNYRERRLGSFFGFGFVFYDIDESGAASVFGGEPRRRNANGLFLDGGMEYRFARRLSVFLDVEVSSAGLKGKSGFQGNSVGGFSIGLGVNAFIF